MGAKCGNIISLKRLRRGERLLSSFDHLYADRKVLITGHTGFKGSWLSLWLAQLGARVYGYALAPANQDNLYNIIRLEDIIESETGDIRDYDHLKKYFAQVRPDFVFHLAAQPIVRESYKSPRYTYETNVMGTVNVCECVRQCGTVRSFLNVTTDKVYKNNEWDRGYTEEDYLDGYDPYSNSKSCSELVTHSYNSSFLREAGVAVSTARAGNVIGGGDFANDRIIPDCVRATVAGQEIILRNPNSIRPFQHVLEPLNAYLMIAARQAEDMAYAGYYNVGPDDRDCVTVETLVSSFCKTWGDSAAWKVKGDGGPHEATFLKLDCGKLKDTFGWSPRWSVNKAVDKTVEWYKKYCELISKKNEVDISGAMRRIMYDQIEEYSEMLK